MSIGNLLASSPSLIERASRAVGDYVRKEGLGANDCTTLFTVLAVRCARLAGANREQFLNYAGQMYDEKSELGKAGASIESLIKLS